MKTQKEIAALHTALEREFAKYPSIILHRRKVNNRGRLDAGFIFHGNEKYVRAGLSYGDDTKDKTPSIGFGFSTDGGNFCLTITSRAPQYYDPGSLDSLARSLGMIYVQNEKRWRKYYQGGLSSAVAQMAAQYPIIALWLKQNEIDGNHDLNGSN